MTRKTLLLCLVFTGIHFIMRAQDNPPLPLSKLFENAADYPGLQAERENVEVAEFSYAITKREIWPQLSLQAQNTFGTYEGTVGGFFPSPGIFNVSGDGASGETAVNALASATLDWKVVQFGKHRDRVKLAKANQGLAENRVELEDICLKRELTGAFLNWQYARYMVRWAKHEGDRNKELLKIARSMVRSGLTASADSLLAGATFKKALADQHKWEGRVEQYANKIKEFSGYEPTENVPTEQFLSPIPQALTDESEENHPLLQEKDRETEALDIRRQSIAHEVLPDISVLVGGMLRGTGFSDQGGAWSESYRMPIDNYLVGLGLRWDISKFYSNGLKKKRVAHKRTKVVHEREHAQRHLDQQKQSLAFKIDKARDEIKNTEDAYRAAQQSFKLFKVRYEKGLIDLTALLQIQQTLQFTEKSRLKAYHDYWMFWNEYAFSRADFSPLTDQFN